MARIPVPGRKVSIRLFERVETKDDQYDIFDIGLEQGDGSIDSVVVGGSFSFAKSLCSKADEKAAKKERKKAAKKAKKAARAKAAEPTVASEAVTTDEQPAEMVVTV